MSGYRKRWRAAGMVAALLVATLPSAFAATRTDESQSNATKLNVAATDFSAARRRVARRRPVEASPAPTQAPVNAYPYYGSSQNFGYGVGDNSHNIIN